MAFNLGNVVDYIGTTVKAPELGLSELLNGGKATINSGGSGARNSGQTGVTGSVENALRNLGNQSSGTTPVPVSNSGGQVNGASTTNPYATQAGAAVGGGITAAQASAQNEARIRGLNQGVIDQGTQAFNKGESEYIAALDKIASLYPQQQANYQAEITDQYNNQASQLQSGLNRSNSQLDASMGRAQGETDSALRYLEQTLRGGMDAANRRLGAMGAGRSSAVGQYGEALTQLSAQEATKINNNASQIYADINRKRDEVLSIYNDQTNTLSTWKNSQMRAIASQYQNFMQQMNMEKAGANREKNAAIANLINQVNMQTSQAVQALDAQAQQYAAQAQQWAQSRSASLLQQQQALEAQLQGTMGQQSGVNAGALNLPAGWQPGNISTSGLRGLIGANTGAQSAGSSSGLYTQARDEQNQLGYGF